MRPNACPSTPLSQIVKDQKCAVFPAATYVARYWEWFSRIYLNEFRGRAFHHSCGHPSVVTHLSMKWCGRNLLLHAFASPAAPFLPRKAVGRVGVRTPVTLDLVAASTVGISAFAADGADFAASLTVFYGLGASGFGILDGFGELLVHISERRFLILY